MTGSTRQPPAPRSPQPRADPDSRRALALALFSVYLVLLAWIVLWKLGMPWTGVARVIKLVPFAATADAGSSSPSEVLVNLLLFVPFGVYLGLVARSWPWWRVGVAAAATSLSLEVAQFVLGVGSSDLTDVIVNAAGAVAGVGLLALVRLALRERAATVVTRICAAGTVVAVLATALFVASPIRLGPPDRGDLPRSAVGDGSPSGSGGASGPDAPDDGD